MRSALDDARAAIRGNRKLKSYFISPKDVKNVAALPYRDRLEHRSIPDAPLNEASARLFLQSEQSARQLRDWPHDADATRRLPDRQRHSGPNQSCPKVRNERYAATCATASLLFRCIARAGAYPFTRKGKMDLHHIHEETPDPPAGRTVKCAYCRERVPLVEAMKGRGVCRLCRLEMAEMSWRTIYDREHQIGEIPANLREAYQL
jgi:hypothetical protein